MARAAVGTARRRRRAGRRSRIVAPVGLAARLAVDCGGNLGRRRRSRRAGNLLMNRLQLASLDIARPEVRDKAKKSGQILRSAMFARHSHPQMLPPLFSTFSPRGVFCHNRFDARTNRRQGILQMRDLFFPRKTIGSSLQQFLRNPK